ncbi:MAG: hypothetical protein WCQ76_03865 [Fusobacterium sp.]
MDNQEKLLEELEEFKKEKDRVKEIVGKIGGKDNIQNKRVNMLLIGMIAALLFSGGVLRKIPLNITMYCAMMLGIVKIIWLLYEMSRANHFQYWILSTIEIRINEISGRIKRIEKSIEELKNGD